MNAAQRQEFCVRWNSHLGSIGAAFPQLLAGQRFVDVTLACEGHQVHCHRLVLAACSSYFESILAENPCKHPVIILPSEIKLWEIQALVDFMYKGEVNVTQAGLPQLLRCAEQLRIRGLYGTDAALNLNQLKALTNKVGGGGIGVGGVGGGSIIPSMGSIHGPGGGGGGGGSVNVGMSMGINSNSMSHLHNNDNVDDDATTTSTTTTSTSTASVIQQSNPDGIGPPGEIEIKKEPDQMNGNSNSLHMQTQQLKQLMQQQQLQQMQQQHQQQQHQHQHQLQQHQQHQHQHQHQLQQQQRDNISGVNSNAPTEDDSNDDSNSVDQYEDYNNTKSQAMIQMDSTIDDEHNYVAHDEDESFNHANSSAMDTEHESSANASLLHNSLDTSGSYKRVRRSEASLALAAKCVSKGQTFQTVSNMFNIPVSTIRFYMARKGILPKRKRGRGASQQSSNPMTASAQALTNAAMAEALAQMKNSASPASLEAQYQLLAGTAAAGGFKITEQGGVPPAANMI